MLEQPSHGQRLPCQGTAVRDGPEEAPGVHVPCCSATPLLINGCSHPAGPLPVTTVAPRPGVGGAIVRWRGYQDPRRPPRLSVTRWLPSSSRSATRQKRTYPDGIGSARSRRSLW